MGLYKYIFIEGKLTTEQITPILNAYKVIFSDYQKESFVKKLNTSNNLVCILAKKGNIVAGFKIGYELKKDTFYSWVGGVIPSHRKRGVAKELQRIQETHITKKGYTTLRTKSTNKFKTMMRFNLKNGFDIIGTEAASNGLKILFEKRL